MKRITRAVLTVTVMAGITASLCGAYTFGASRAEAAMACGPEDSRSYNAAKCGNRTMGVKIDPTPNNGKAGSTWVVLKFSKDGKTGTFRPRGF